MSDLTLIPALVNAADGPIVFVATGRQDEELSSEPHRHARGQLFGSHAGLLSVGLESGVWVVPSIHAVWLPPHHLHSGRSHGPFRGWAAYVARAPASTCRRNPARSARPACRARLCCARAPGRWGRSMPAVRMWRP